MLQNTLSLFLYKAAIGGALDWEQVATVVVAGVGIVLGVLIVLIFVFSGFGKLVSSMEAASKKRAAKKAAKKVAKEAAEATEKAQPAPVQVKSAPSAVKAPVAPAPIVEAGISGEVVAAITAAIAAQEGNGNFVIRNLKKKEVGSRNPWARAAVMDNTRGF